MKVQGQVIQKLFPRMGQFCTRSISRLSGKMVGSAQMLGFQTQHWGEVWENPKWGYTPVILTLGVLGQKDH